MSSLFLPMAIASLDMNSNNNKRHSKNLMICNIWNGSYACLDCRLFKNVCLKEHNQSREGRIHDCLLVADIK